MGLEVIVASIYGLGMCLLAPQCVVQVCSNWDNKICGYFSSCHTRQIVICWLLLAGDDALPLNAGWDADVMPLTGGFDGSYL